MFGVVGPSLSFVLTSFSFVLQPDVFHMLSPKDPLSYMYGLKLAQISCVIGRQILETLYISRKTEVLNDSFEVCCKYFVTDCELL